MYIINECYGFSSKYQSWTSNLLSKATFTCNWSRFIKKFEDPTRVTEDLVCLPFLSLRNTKPLEILFLHHPLYVPCCSLSENDFIGSLWGQEFSSLWRASRCCEYLTGKGICLNQLRQCFHSLSTSFWSPSFYNPSFHSFPCALFIPTVRVWVMERDWMFLQLVPGEQCLK